MSRHRPTDHKTDNTLSQSGIQRRDVLKIVAVGAAGVGAWRLGLLSRSSTVAVQESRNLMGTVVNLTVVSEDREAARTAVTATLDRMAEMEAYLSRYREDSEISQLVAEGRIDNASEALIDVLQLSDRVSRMGDGAFDITVQPVLDLYRTHLSEHQSLPTRKAIEQAVERVDFRSVRVAGRTVTLDRPDTMLTVDGIGKGYVVDQGVAELKRRGWSNVFVEAGGDLVASGDNRQGEPWRIGIRSPRKQLSLQAKLDARDKAVATSGDYMQPFTPDYSQHHILDPRTGLSSPELASSTIVAPDAATADGLATLTMVLGPTRSRELLEELPDCEGYFVTKDLRVVRTSGFEVA
jgi:thiamine biosynthesis lipoprotein